MRQTLIRIPLDAVLHIGPFTLPWFGFGIVLAVWIAVGLGWYLWSRRQTAANQPVDSNPWIVWGLIAVAIIAAPSIQQRLGITGVPIFGYGFMLFVGFVTAVSLAGRRAVQQGLSPDIVWDLAPWILIPGILGARTFFSIQYAHEVFGQARGPGEALAAFLNLSSGGLVLYGGLIGGATSAKTLEGKANKISIERMTDIFFISLPSIWFFTDNMPIDDLQKQRGDKPLKPNNRLNKIKI